MFQDTIWGEIALPTFVKTVIDTPTFQRLRYLRQNGLLHLVFDGAVHTRFAHSIGTAWLAYKLVSRLKAAQPELHITDGEVHTVVVAALCHDLGHGPCSHAFDMFMSRVDPGWSHEAQSVALLQHLVSTSPAVQAAVADAGVNVHTACELVLGSKDKAPRKWRWAGPPPGRQFLYEIVSSSPTGIDVDKWDYIRRDSFYLNIPNGFVCKRLLKHCRVIDGRLAWPRSETATIMDMFHTRFQLHDRAYQHRSCRVMDHMVMRALYDMKDYVVGTCADTGLPVTIEHAHLHATTYIRLTDSIVDCGLQDALDVGRLNSDARLLFRRVQMRDLWQVVAEVNLPKTFGGSAKDVSTMLAERSGVPASRFCIDVAHINCGKGRRNPMRNVRLFPAETRPCVRVLPVIDAAEPATDTDIDAAADAVGGEYLRPTSFQKRILRLFVCVAADVEALHTAFATHWCSILRSVLG